jgi:hypothetical protein
MFVVVGSEEMDAGTVNVRNVRDEAKGGKGEIWKLQRIVSALVDLKEKRNMDQSLTGVARE